MVEFPKTKASVEKLLDLLRCDNCSKTLHEPFTNGVCSHTLCYDCCSASVAPIGSRSKKHTGTVNVCPLCYIPIRPCDVKPHPQLHNLVLIARRLAKLFGSIDSTPQSSSNLKTGAVKNAHEDLEFLNSVDYYHFESPSPSNMQKPSSGPIISAKISPVVTASSPVQLTISLQSNVELAKGNENVENKTPAEAMPPPSVPAAKKLPRRRSASTRVLSEKNNGTKADGEAGIMAPLASPEKSGIADSLATPPPAYISPLKRRVSNRSNSGGSGVRRFAPWRKAKNGTSGVCSSGSGGGDSESVDLKLNSKGESIIHRAAIKNDVTQLKRLLISGMSPNMRDHAGWTPLHEAALRGHVEAAECLLVDGHAAVDIPGGPDLETALHEAVFNRRVELVRLLLRHGANPTFANGQGISPLQMCAQYLAEARNELNIKTSKGSRFKGQNPVEVLKDFQTICELINAAAKKTSEMETALPAASDLAASALFIERRRLRPLLLATGLNRNQKNMLTRVANLIHARIATSTSSEVTHLITGAQMTNTKVEKQQQKKKKCKKRDEITGAAEGITCPRTLKFLIAVLQGCWVLSFDWIETCDALKMRVEEEAFEVTGCSTAPDTCASRRARCAREAGSAGLFSGYRFCLLGTFSYPTPDRADLSNLLTCGEAILFSRDITSPSRLAYLAVDDPVIADAWVVQQDANTQDSQLKAKLSLTATTGDFDTTVHLHQLIALYDPRASGLLSSASLVDEASAKVAATNTVVRPEELVRAALQMLQPRSRYSSPASAVNFQPIILVPATWVMDCIAEYHILPLPTLA